MNLWNELNEDEKKELLVAYNESFDDHNLLTHEEVKSQHKKWLGTDDERLPNISIKWKLKKLSSCSNKNQTPLTLPG